MSSELNFLDRVLKIVREELADNNPLIEFRHPEDLREQLKLEIRGPTSEEDLEKCIRLVVKYSVKTNKFAFRNQLYGATDPYGLAGSWIAEAFNTSQYTYEVAPAFTLVELEMIRHMLFTFRLPKHGDGIFSPGGSISNMYAMVAARYKTFPSVKTNGMAGLPTMVIFTSEDSHYSIRKGAHWLGFGTDNIVFIPTNAKGQMKVPELELAILKTKDEGKCPLMVNATAGTTVLGAIDELDKISEVCRKHFVWLHVDACWGGSLILSKSHRHKLRGIEKADSVAWNPHKMLGAPLQCSVLLIVPELLHKANSASAHYLFQQDKFYDVRFDTGDKSVQCGRKVDSFKLWVMWKARGDEGLGSLVDRAMDTAQLCHEYISTRPGFRLLSEELECPNVCFWYIPSFMRGSEENEQWWDKMHKITPKIKELLTVSSKLMVCYTPLRHYKNFFRMAFTCHPSGNRREVLEMVHAIETYGETITEDMI